MTTSNSNQTASGVDAGASSLRNLLSASALTALEKDAALGDDYRELRNASAARVAALEFPSARSELWRQTTPEKFPFADLISSGGSCSFELKDFGSAKSVGAFKGVTLQNSLVGQSTVLTQLLKDRLALDESCAVSALQLATVRSACVLRFGKNVVSEEPLLLSQIEKQSGAAQSSLVVVVLERGARANLIEDFAAKSATFWAPRVEVLIGEGASLNFTSIQELSGQAKFLGRYRFHMERDASLKTLHAVFGASVSRIDLDCRFYGPGSNADLRSIYLGTGDRHIDFHPVQEHLAPYCRSELYCKGALKDSARGVYYGYIKVAEGADKTDAFQKNRNLVLSEGARVDTIPNLEIKANDVKCSHGATVGQVGADELFYLMSRGLSRGQAERILVEGFFEDLLASVKHEVLHERISALALGGLYGGV